MTKTHTTKGSEGWCKFCSMLPIMSQLELHYMRFRAVKIGKISASNVNWMTTR